MTTRQTKKLTMVRGDSKTWTVTARDTAGDVYDLTGASIIFTVRKTKDLDEDITVQKKNTAAGGDATEIEDSDLANGQFKIHISPSDTEDIVGGNYYYDIEITTALSLKYTPANDILYIEEDVTF